MLADVIWGEIRKWEEKKEENVKEKGKTTKDNERIEDRKEK
jgi:hypothetical protein